MKFFILHAHPEPTSFNAALTQAATSTLREAGHEVVVSDLYAMQWDPVSDRRNFTTVKNAKVYRQTEEEMFAAAREGLVPAIKAEVDKLLWCDTLILQFPLWWFSMPAIMKGWIDRVFVMGPIYGRNVWYDAGRLKGRRAMVSVTTGSIDKMFDAEGINGSMERILHPIHRGILRFVGFDVMQPWICHAPVMMEDDERETALGDYRQTLSTLHERPLLQFPSLDEYEPMTYERKAKPGS